jgi:peptide/nickel transport system ATP-binding protein
MTVLLQARDLARHYRVAQPGRWWSQSRTLRAVDGVSFDISQGRTLGLVGESGCGKSTTARLVLGLLPLTAGGVRFEGEDVSHRRDARWRQQRSRMQMVYQDPLAALDRRLSVLSQVIEPLQVFGLGTPAEQRVLARDLMAAVGLTPALFERRPHELSGGQRQRVVLARALVVRPRLLVCDEPVSALDVSIQAQVINLLDEVRQRFGVAMLFISHDLKIIRQVSDEVAVMYLGRIVEQGPADELLHRPAHPYTQALVAAIPQVQQRASAPRQLLQGDPPSPVDMPTGCAFHPRCAQAVPRCRDQRPLLQPVLSAGGDHRVACHLATSPGAPGAPAC